MPANTTPPMTASEVAEELNLAIGSTVLTPDMINSICKAMANDKTLYNAINDRVRWAFTSGRDLDENGMPVPLETEKAEARLREAAKEKEIADLKARLAALNG